MIYPPEDAEGFALWMKEKGAVSEFREWAAGKDFRTAWETCERGDWMEWILLNAWGFVWRSTAFPDYARIDAARAEYRRIVNAALAEYRRIEANEIRSLISINSLDKEK